MTNDELAEFIVAEVRQYVDTTLLRSIERLEASFAAQVERAVEERMKALPAPEPGAPGKDADPDLIRSLVTQAVASIPVPKDGEPGKDGKDGNPGKDGKDIDRAELDAAVSFAVSLIPKPKNGDPGKPGENGKDADPEVIRAEVAKAVSALPVAKDGKDGEDAKPVDLLVVKALVAGEVAHAVAAMSPPKDGRDGKDGITVDQMEATTLKVVAAVMGELHMDGRKLMLGDRLIKTFPIPMWIGVYEAGTSYEQGDMVTFGGNVWHCNEATTDKPEATRAWQLAVKKGRDFRPPDRDRPPQGPVKQ